MKNEIASVTQETPPEKARRLAREGYTLSYRGARYTPTSFEDRHYIDRDPTFTPFQALCDRFSNLGAMIIRFHIGQGQRAGLLQQISKPTYADNPVEKPAKGGDDSNLFFDTDNPDDPKAIGQLYEFASHANLGRGKLLNERSQPLVHVNQEGLYGEQAIWDIIHSPVWGVGRGLQYELAKQGFAYVTCPSHISHDSRVAISKELESNQEHYRVVLDRHGLGTELAKLSELQIELDDKGSYTKESNGLAIKVPAENTYNALGWIVHQSSGHTMPHSITEDIIRVTAIAKGGFYEKRPTQQKILQGGGLLNSSGLGLFTQNQAFNAMYGIFDFLQRYDFDPRALLDNALLNAYERLHKKCIDEPEIIDDFLVGALQAEMVQPLRVSQPQSKRSELPLRFTNPFMVSLNNLKAIAYAFGLSDAAGQPIFRAYDDSPIINNSDQIDYTVNGKLALPSFNTGSSVAVILSTAALVAEQLVLEQLLSNVLKTDKNFFKRFCTTLLGEAAGQQLYDEIVDSIIECPAENGRFILGAQFEYCQPVLDMFRKAVGLDKLPRLVTRFAHPGAHTHDVLAQLSTDEQEQLRTALRNLNKMGALLQQSPLTSGASENSRGICAGLQPLIRQVYPELVQELHLAEDNTYIADVPPINKARARDRISMTAYKKCPFLNNQGIAPEKQVKQSPSFFQTVWENRGVVALGIVAGAFYLSNSK